ncbi:hypothetical protein ACQB60_23605 [Actinomycetota bacterium Odt1-20B]
MSSSDRRRERAEYGVPFVVIPDTPSVMVTVTDAAFEEVIHRMGTVETTLTPGIYRIEQRFGGAVDSKLVEVGGEPFVERLPLPRIPTPAPLVGTSSTREDHQEAAVRFSRASTHGTGVPSLMVLLRNLRRGRRLAPYALEVAAEDGTPVDGGEDGWTSSGDQEWSAFSAPLAPGGYRLRTRVPNGGGYPLAQALWVQEGWTTMVFVPNGSQGPEPQYASVHMAREGDGWSDADPARSLALEAALSGLRQGLELVSDEQISLMLHSKKMAPFLGIVGAHAMLLGKGAALDREWQRDMIHRLLASVPGHPDALALATLLPADQRADLELPSVTAPPQLVSSCRLLVAADAVDPGVIEDGSVAESAAAHLVGRGVWTTWLEQEPRRADEARGGLPGAPPQAPAGPRPDAADPVDRVRGYVQQIAAIEGKDVDTVLRELSAKELCRRTGLPHKAVERAVAGLRAAE